MSNQIADPLSPDSTVALPLLAATMIRVFLIADLPIVRAGLAAILTAESHLTVVGQANWEALAIEVAAAEVVLISAELSEAKLNDVAPWLTTEPTAPEILWLVPPLQDSTMPETLIAEALKLGILGLLPQDATSSEIVRSIEAVAAGLVVLHPDIASLLLNPNARLLTPVTQMLTQREIEVLQMLAAGMANKTIAKQLQISEHTVKFHISSIFSKLNVSSRTEAVTIGLRQGLIVL